MGYGNNSSEFKPGLGVRKHKEEYWNSSGHWFSDFFSIASSFAGPSVGRNFDVRKGFFDVFDRLQIEWNKKERREKWKRY